MLNLKRVGFVGVCCVVAIATVPLATAAGTQKAKAIQTTQRLTTLSSDGSGVTNVGTSDGKIAGAGVHGALRAVVKAPTPTEVHCNRDSVLCGRDVEVHARRNDYE